MVMFDLPWDLVEEILSRVPARSLGRLRTTCKRVNGLCKDTDFINKHLDKAAKENLVLMLRNFRVYSLILNLNEIHNNITVDPSIEFTSKLSISLNDTDQVDIITEVFHCNGLLLCYTKEEIKTKLMVVNPCTGQTRWIEPRSFYNMFDRYALGYANNNSKSYESYKILRFSYDWNQLEIFELKSNSWRFLANIPPNEDQRTYGSGVSLKGNAYWISYFSFKFDILSFDFTPERFRRLCLPFSELGYNTIALSVVREEKLSVLHRRFNLQKMEIWVTNKIDDTETVFSWSKSFTLRLHDHRVWSPKNLLIDEEKKLVVSYGRNVVNNKNMIYIVGKHGCRKFDYDTDSYHCPLFSYVPSLVCLYPPL